MVTRERKITPFFSEWPEELLPVDAGKGDWKGFYFQMK
jgi:hypothetical protein